MKGAHQIIIQNKRIRYDFIIKRNLTVIRGDSATGKTTLVDMVREYFENGTSSAVELNCDKQCAILEGRTWLGQLSVIKDSIVFIDEGNDFVTSSEFASAIQETDNYYVIVSREAIPALPYSVEEVYGIRNSGKYGTLKKTYNEFYHLYTLQNSMQTFKPDCIVTEDSHAGFHFFQGVCEESNDSIISIPANGKSNIFSIILKQPDIPILVVADGAAFGSEMNKLEELIRERPNIVLYLPESFEWLILKSGVIENKNIHDILEHPEDQIESKDYFSWERYFTSLLIQVTNNTFLKYNKRQLNPVYLQKKIKNKILDIIKCVELPQ